MPKNPVKAVDEARTKLAKLKAEYREISNRPVSTEETNAAIDDYLDRMADRYRQSRVIDALATQASIESLHADDPEAFVAFFFPEQIKKQLQTAIDDRVSDGLPAGDRAQQLRDIEAALKDAERDEETIIREAEQDGLSITRRADADPRIVLDLD